MTEKNESHTKWMKRAIFLASLGKNTTSPNPRVGAVILDKNGNLISEGFHYKAGMPHAEAMAFNNLKKDANEGSMYVNLEPCCHHGKTPPCVDKVISSGIKKVYISIEDPDKRVSGKGTTSPNPMVGAVILDKDGNHISEGFHLKSGMPHAEAMAFNNLKRDASGGSIYVLSLIHI